MVLTDPASRTLPLAQYASQGQFDTDYTVAFSQRWVISGVMRGSIK